MMSRMIDDEEELKDYELIEKCSNLVTDENKCLDTWDDENADYKECKRINCHKKQLKRLEAENKHLKKEVETWSYQAEKRAKIGNILYDTAQKYKQALEDIRESCNTYAKTGDYVIDQTFNEFLENVFNKTNEVLNK